MALRIIADKLDDLPEALRDGAKEEGGKFIASLAEGWAVEDVSALRNALRDEKDRRRKAMERLEAFDGIEDPGAARDALDKLRAGSLRSSKDIDEWKKQVEAKVASDLKSREEQLSQYERQIKDLEFGTKARDAILKHKGKPALLLPLLEKRIRWERDADGRLQPRLIGDDGKDLISKKSGSANPMDLEEFVAVLKSDENYLAAFDGSGTGGSGATHAAGGSGRVGNDTTLSPEARLAAIAERTTVVRR